MKKLAAALAVLAFTTGCDPAMTALESAQNDPNVLSPDDVIRGADGSMRDFMPTPSTETPELQKRGGPVSCLPKCLGLAEVSSGVWELTLQGYGGVAGDDLEAWLLGLDSDGTVDSASVGDDMSGWTYWNYAINPVAGQDIRIGAFTVPADDVNCDDVVSLAYVYTTDATEWEIVVTYDDIEGIEACE